MQLLTKEHIYLIHKNVIGWHGGLGSFFDNTDDKIESVLAQQYPIFDYEKYPDIFQKAAMLWYFFTKDHCFVDGNKRVGWNSCIILLSLNGKRGGWENAQNDDAIIAKCLEISSSQVEEPFRDRYIDSLAKWLCDLP